LAQRSAILVDDSFRVGVGLLTAEVADGAGTPEIVDPVTDAAVLEKVCPADLDDVGGTTCGKLRCS
jgi:hypothetical protein